MLLAQEHSMAKLMRILLYYSVKDTSLCFSAPGIFTPGMLANLSAIETIEEKHLIVNGDSLCQAIRKEISFMY
jgi:hypothetical protein